MDAGIKVVLITLYEFCKEAGFKHPHMIIVEELINPSKMETNIKNIKLTVYDCFDITEQQGDKVTRKREIVKIRQIAMELSYRIGMETQKNWSLAEVGEEIGEKDHATVLHAIKTVNNLRETDRAYNDKYRSTEIEVRFKIRQYGTTGKNESSESSESIR